MQLADMDGSTAAASVYHRLVALVYMYFWDFSSLVQLNIFSPYCIILEKVYPTKKIPRSIRDSDC